MESIIKTAERAEQLAANFITRISTLEKQVAEHEAQAVERAELFSKLDGDQDASVQNVVTHAAREGAKREAHEYRRTLATASEAERTDRLKTLMEMNDKATTLAPLFQGPVQLLSRDGLGNPERTHYQAQLRDAGPRELQNYADWALYKDDHNLAAAVLSRLDTMPRDRRPFKAVEFATRILGDEFVETRKAIKCVQVAAQRALNANRDFESGQVDSVAKISMGLARRNA